MTATVPDGIDPDDEVSTQLAIAQTIADLADVVAVAPIDISADGTLAAFQVIPADGPNSESTEQLVRDLRALPELEGGIRSGSQGRRRSTSTSRRISRDILPLYLAVVVGLSLLIMIVVFRSLLVPIIATAGFVLSLFATYGALVAVFQWGWWLRCSASRRPARS